MRMLVLSEDERLLEASKALPGPTVVERFGDRVSFLAAAQEGCEVAVVDLKAGGFAACRDLRAMPGGDEVAIVVLCDREQDRWVCGQAGADEVLIAPLADTSTLIEAVLRALNSRGKSL